LIIIHFILWFLFFFPFGKQIFAWGIGHNFSIHVFDQYWRFITPIFLHMDLTHVVFNSFSLVLFAPALEKMLGKFKFIIIYLLAGIIGNICTYIINPLDITQHLGASGSIYGLFGIYIFMVVFRKDLIDQTSAQIVLIISAIGLVMTFINPGINVPAHIFGFLGGLLCA